MNFHNHTLPYSEEFHDLWISEFRNWAQMNHGIDLGNIIANGKEQRTDIRYCLKFNTNDPVGYVITDYQKELWYPSYRLESAEIDSRQLIAAHGPYFEKEVWNFDKKYEPKYFSEFALSSKNEIIHAQIISINVVRLSNMWEGIALKKIQVGFNTRLGSISMLIDIYGNGQIVPPGCGSLTAGRRVVLSLTKYAQNIARLNAIYSEDALFKVAK